MKRVFAICALAVGLLAGGTAPALACGDTPGFCPNPPDNSSDGGWVQGTGGDF
jgi:hypothetical protein